MRPTLVPILALALTFAAGCAPADRARDAGTPTPPDSITLADGTRLFHRTVGDGGPAVLVPADFLLHPAFDRIAEGRRLHYYDMRNRGRSDSVGVDRANSIEQDVRDLEEVRGQLGLEKVDLIGFSYLGLVVALYAMEHPDRVRRVVQIGPVPMRFGAEYPEGLGPENWSAALDSVALADLRRLQAEGWPADRPAEYCEREQAVTQVTLVGDPANVSRLNQDACSMPNEWPIRLAAHFARHFASVQALVVDTAAVARIACPVLTVHGTRDRNAAYGAGREWAMRIPDARLLTVPGAAHCAWADEPERVFGAIDTFLDGGWPEGAEKVTSLVPGSAP